MATQSKSHGPQAPASPSSAGPVEPRPLAFFACPNPDCPSFNVFGGDNLSVAEYMGKNKAIRRLYCKVCHGRFSERQGSLLQDSKLPPAEVVRIVKCFGYGLPVAATADICAVNPRTVQRLLEKGGQRAQDFHQLQLVRAQAPLEAVQLDEMHGHVAGDTRDEKGGLRRWLRRWKPAARR
jgi:transposase-like protein